MGSSPPATLASIESETQESSDFSSCPADQEPTYRLDIPAVEFLGSVQKRPNPSPPQRILHPSPPTSSKSRSKRQSTAAALRAASLCKTRARCRQQTLHAASVARTVRENRLNLSAQRRTASNDQLIRAELRRSSLKDAVRSNNGKMSSSSSAHIAPSSVHQSKATPISPSSVVAGAASSSLDAACDVHTFQIVAGKIAALYLLSRSRRVLRHAGLLGPAISSASFDSIAARVQTTPALSAARMALRAITIHLNSEHSTEKTPTPRPSDSRILLSALLIATHPAVVASSPLPGLAGVVRATTHDEDVISKARAVAFALHAAPLSLLSRTWRTWRPTFMAWKARDKSHLVDALIASALAAAERDRAAMGQLSALSDVTCMYRCLNGEENTEAGREAGSSTWLDEIRTAVAAVDGQQGVARLNDALQHAGQRRDERLVHELVIDPERLANSFCAATNVPAVAWERMRAELVQKKPNLLETSTRLAFVRRVLTSLGAKTIETDWPTVESASELNASFVCSLIRVVASGCMECQAEAFDTDVQNWASDATFRVRHAVTCKTSSPNVLANIAVSILQEATDLVTGVHAHVVSWRIQRAANDIAAYGAAWERARFAERVERREVSLQRTKQWLRLGWEQFTRCSRCTDGEGCQPNLWGIISYGVMVLTTPIATSSQNVANSDTPLSKSMVPEVFLMDVQRLQRVKDDIRQCAVISVIRHTVNASRDIEVCEADAGIWAERIASANNQERLDEIVETWLSECKNVTDINTRSDSNLEVLRGMIRRVAAGNDRTYELMVRRISDLMAKECTNRRSTGMSSSSPTRVDKEILKQAGLSAMESSVNKICTEVFRIVRHTITVHGDRLFHLLDKVEGVSSAERNEAG